MLIVAPPNKTSWLRHYMVVDQDKNNVTLITTSHINSCEKCYIIRPTQWNYSNIPLRIAK